MTDWTYSLFACFPTQATNRFFCESGGGTWSTTTVSCSGLASPPHKTSSSAFVYTQDITDGRLVAYADLRNGACNPPPPPVSSIATCDGSGTAGDQFTHGLLSSSTMLKRIDYPNGPPQCNQTSTERFHWAKTRTVGCRPGSNMTYVNGVAYCTTVISNMCKAGNPVDPGNGEKYHLEPTLVGTGFDDLLRLHYRSYGDANTFAGGDGFVNSNWRFGFDRRIGAADSNFDTLVLFVPGRQSSTFRKNANGVYVAALNTRSFGAEITRDASGYTLLETNLERWRFNLGGIPISRTLPDGRTETFSWTSNTQLSITDERGRQVSLTRVTVTDAGGNLTGSRITVQLLGGQTLYVDTDRSGLVSAISTPAGTRQFLYGDSSFPAGLTGLVDENGVQHRRYTYESYRVVNEYLVVNGADVLQYNFNYRSGGVDITNPLGQINKLTYRTANGVRNLASQSTSCPSCGTTSVNNSYDSFGNVVSTTDARGVVTEYTWDTARVLETRRIEAKSAPGVPNPTSRRTIETTWHPTLRLPVQARTLNAQNVLEQQQSWAYNARGQKLARCVQDPGINGAVGYLCASATHAPSGVRQSSFSYCEAGDLTQPTTGCAFVGQLKAVDGPRTDVQDLTTYRYYLADEPNCASSPANCAYRKGDLFSVTNAAGHATQYLRYDPSGRVMQIRDQNGVITDLSYSSAGWLEMRALRERTDGVPSAADSITRTTYDAYGAVKRVTNPDGSFIEYTRDSAHRLVSVVDNLGNRINYTLDAAGNQTEERTLDPTGQLKRLIARQYDSDSRITAVIANANDPAGSRYVFTYDSVGNSDLATDPLGHITDTDHDELGRPIKAVVDQSASGIRATFLTQYDARNNIRRSIDPKGLATVYEYDGLDELSRMTSPDAGTKTFTYDSAGNQRTETDARGVTATRSYDNLNRVMSITFPQAGEDVAIGWDTPTADCPVGERNGIGRMSWFSDESGSTLLCYDRQGNLVRKIQNNGSTRLVTAYSYTLGQLSGITYPSGSEIRYARDATGRINALQLTPSGGVEDKLITSIGYLPFGPISQVRWASGHQYSLEYDRNYRIDRITSNISNGLNAHYSTDDLGNIIEITSGSSTSTYGYDSLYRLTSDHRNGTLLQSYSYDATGNRLSNNLDGYGYLPDSHRLNNIGVKFRTYDANGNLTQMDRYDRSGAGYRYNQRNRMAARQVNGLDKNIYYYNARGERVRKSGQYKDAPRALFSFDEDGKILGEYDEAGARVREYIWADDQLLAIHDRSGWSAVETDHLGTPRRIVDSQRLIATWAWNETSEAFGNAPADADADGDGVFVDFNLRFPGQYLDQESGLHYNFFRDYEPQTGRYLESDPIGPDLSGTTYAYVSGTPLTVADPEGLDGICRCPDGSSAVSCSACPMWKATPVCKCALVLLGMDIAASAFGPGMPLGKDFMELKPLNFFNGLGGAVYFGALQSIEASGAERADKRMGRRMSKGRKYKSDVTLGNAGRTGARFAKGCARASAILGIALTLYDYDKARVECGCDPKYK